MNQSYLAVSLNRDDLEDIKEYIDEISRLEKECCKFVDVLVE